MPVNDWTLPHSHDPNLVPPGGDPSLRVVADGLNHHLGLQDIVTLPQTTVPGCYIVSTGHGISGPFAFGGVRLVDILTLYTKYPWDYVDVVSGDGFRTRLMRDDLMGKSNRPAILALTIDGRPLERAEGLVRLIVPSETEDALRQVKWVSEIRVY